MAELKLLDKLLQLFRRTRHPHLPSTLIFAPLDAEKIKDDKDLEQRGRDRGARDQPLSDATEPDDVETEITAYIDNCATYASNELLAELNSYAQRLASLDFDSAASDIKTYALKVFSDLKTQLNTGADDVFLARNRVVGVQKQFERFKVDNGLERIASYPEGRLLYWGFFGFLIVIESVLNGVFIGQAHIFGLMGGVAVAFVIAFVNVSLGGFSGHHFLPQLNHCRPWRKLAGGVLLVAYLAIVLTGNLVVAHYRDALAAGQWETADTAALAAFINSPLGIEDLNSWLLFVMGLLFSLFAFSDGYRMEDPYPGYGNLDRRVRQVLEDYAEIKRDCLANLEESKDEAIEAMQQDKNQLTNQRAEYASIVAARQRLAGSYSDHLRHLETTANQLLSAYREANRQARSTNAPPYFQRYWKLDRPPPPAFDGMDAQRMEAAVKTTKDVLDRHIEETHAAYDKAVAAFKGIEQLSEEELTRGSAREIIEAT